MSAAASGTAAREGGQVRGSVGGDGDRVDRGGLAAQLRPHGVAHRPPGADAGPRRGLQLVGGVRDESDDGRTHVADGDGRADLHADVAQPRVDRRDAVLPGLGQPALHQRGRRARGAHLEAEHREVERALRTRCLR